LSALNVQISGDRLGLGTDLFSDKNTLAEQSENFEEETVKYSEYYFNQLIMQ
jgi:phosphoglycerol transferase